MPSSRSVMVWTWWPMRAQPASSSRAAAFVTTRSSPPPTSAASRWSSPARATSATDVRLPMIILGVDPGLRRTGFGAIEAHGAQLRYLASGTIVVPPALPLHGRLKVILDNLREVARDVRPDQAALEKV